MKRKLYNDYTFQEYDEEQWSELLQRFPLLQAAGGIVRNPCGEILMILKRNKWDLPKGTLEVGEAAEQCALREVQEECGVQGLTICAPQAETYHIYLEKDGIEYIKHTQWFTMGCDNSCKPRPQTEEYITQAVWASPQQVKENLKNAYPSIIDLLMNLK